MEDAKEQTQTPSVKESKRPSNKLEIGKKGVEIAKETLKNEFGELVEGEMLNQVSNLLEALPHDKFIKGMIIRTEGDEDMIGYRTIEGKLAINADALESEDHAFQVGYHELLEKLSARFQTGLRSFHKFHDGIIQYFVRQAVEKQGRRYYLSAYEGISDIVAQLIRKGVPESLWKEALVSNERHRELMSEVNSKLENKKGFREIDWALDRNDWSKIKELLS